MNEREKNDQRCQLLGLDKMMTKDEAKELTDDCINSKLNISHATDPITWMLRAYIASEEK